MHLFITKLTVKKINMLLLFCFMSTVLSCSSENYIKTEPSMLVTDYEESLFLRRIWREVIDTDDKYQTINLSPAVTDNRVFLATKNGKIIAIDENNFFVWEKQLNLKVTSGIQHNDDLITFGSSDGDVVVLDATDGKIIWQNKVLSQINVNPMFMGEKLIVKGGDNSISAFDIDDGTLLWEQKFNLPPLSLKGQSEMLSISTYIIVGLDNGKIAILDEKDGRVLLKKQLHSIYADNVVSRLNDINSDILLIGRDIVAASYQGIVTRISLNNFKTKWINNISTFNSFVYDGVTIFIFDENDVLKALSPETGKVLWENKSLKNRNLSQPTLIGDNLLVADAFGFIHLLDSRNGRTISQVQYGAMPLSGKITIKDNRAYVQSANGEYHNLVVVKKQNRNFIHFK